MNKLDLFKTLDKIYTSENTIFINSIDKSVSPVILNLMLSRYYKIAHVVEQLDKYIYILDTKEYSMLAWSLIQPKLLKTPFVKKVNKIEEHSIYDFILDKIKDRFEISDNDWKECKHLYLQDVKNNTVDYLVFYGFSKKYWTKLGLDFSQSKKYNITNIKEGLDKWF